MGLLDRLHYTIGRLGAVGLTECVDLLPRGT